MRPSLRFLALVVCCWGGVRAASLGVLPGAEIFEVVPSQAKVPPIVPTQFPEIEPIPPATPLPAAADAYGMPPAFYPAAMPTLRYVRGAAGVPMSLSHGAATIYQLPPSSEAVFDLPPRTTHFSASPAAYSFADYSTFAPLDLGPLSQVAALSGPASHASGITSAQSVPAAALKRSGIDRLQLTSWALLRAQSPATAGSQSLASGGSLGASQAGARLMYNFNRQVAATLRSTSDVGRRGGEIAAGVRVQPLAGIPLWIDAERRQRIGRYGGGRSAFALLFEGGIYDRPMPLHFLLDGYLQAGVVGVRQRDKFIDGALTLTRPVYKQFSAGVGVWGGAQPGLYRVDAGPRVTMRVRRSIRVHFDWRQRLAGNAQPGSGPAVTLAGDF